MALHSQYLAFVQVILTLAKPPQPFPNFRAINATKISITRKMRPIILVNMNGAVDTFGWELGGSWVGVTIDLLYEPGHCLIIWRG